MGRKAQNVIVCAHFHFCYCAEKAPHAKNHFTNQILPLIDAKNHTRPEISRTGVVLLFSV